MTDPTRPRAALEHAGHDLELVASLAARTPELDTIQRTAARDLVDRCADCRNVLADLLALQTALPAARTPARPRDFRLTEADEMRLRPAGWRRTIGFFGSARDAVSRPLAIGFTTVGVVALLITVAPTFQLGAGGAARVLSTVGSAVEPQREAAGAAEPSAAPAPAAVPSPAASAAASAAAAQPAASVPPDETAVSAEPYATAGDQGSVFTGSNDGDTQSEGDAGNPGVAAGEPGLLTSLRDDGLSLGIVIAGISLIIGFGLFALRWTAGRLREG